MLKLRTPYICLVALFLAACATRQEVAEDYKEALRVNSSASPGRVVVLFLIDGLPVSTLKDEVIKNR